MNWDSYCRTCQDTLDGCECCSNCGANPAHTDCNDGCKGYKPFCDLAKEEDKEAVDS